MLKKKLTSGIIVEQIATLVDGTIIGDRNAKVFSLCPLEELDQGSLSFIKKVSVSSLKKITADPRVSALLIPTQVNLEKITDFNCALIRVDDPIKAVVTLVPYFFDLFSPTPSISPKADIDPSASIGERVYIGAFSVISANVVIEDDAMIYPNVTIYPHAKIGRRAVVHANAVIRESCSLGEDVIVQNGAVIGADGFGYYLDPELGLRAVPQVGNTVLADRVEVGANSCIDRGTLGSTTVDNNTKIDNLVQIGHNTKIGSNSILCGMVGISGSAKIGNQVTLAGNVGVADHVTVADGIRVGAKAGIPYSLNEKGDYAGFPAIPIREWHRQVSSLSKLPEMMTEIKKRDREEDS